MFNTKIRISFGNGIMFRAIFHLYSVADNNVFIFTIPPAFTVAKWSLN